MYLELLKKSFFETIQFYASFSEVSDIRRNKELDLTTRGIQLELILKVV